MNIDDYRNESFRKIGRNLWYFQRLEFMLKHILSSCTSGFTEDVIKNREKTHTKTLGQLTGLYLNKANPDNVEDLIDNERLKQEPHISISLGCFDDPSFIESKRVELENLVLDRNELAHHLLPQFDINSIESCILLDNKLDTQREKVIDAIEHLKPILLVLTQLAGFSKSAEFKTQYKIAILKENRVIKVLCDISEKNQRDDGWSQLNIAGQLIREHEQEALSLIKKEYGQKSLKSLMEASELFEFCEELTEKGIRQLFRLKTT